MIARGLAVASALALLAFGSASHARQKRIWIDPPPDLVPATPPPPASALEPPADLGAETTGSLEPPQPVLVTSPIAPATGTLSPASCTVRTYVVLSGATVRVVGC